jgi:hypothetical protein
MAIDSDDLLGNFSTRYLNSYRSSLKSIEKIKYYIYDEVSLLDSQSSTYSWPHDKGHENFIADVFKSIDSQIDLDFERTTDISNAHIEIYRVSPYSSYVTSEGLLGLAVGSDEASLIRQGLTFQAKPIGKYRLVFWAGELYGNSPFVENYDTLKYAEAHTLIHEIGHSLGLSHPQRGVTDDPRGAWHTDKDSVMSYNKNPFYANAYFANAPTWSQSDVSALQSLWGTENDGQIGYSVITARYDYGNGDYYFISGTIASRHGGGNMYAGQQILADSSSGDSFSTNLNSTGYRGSYRILTCTNYSGDAQSSVNISSYYDFESGRSVVPFRSFPGALGSEGAYLLDGGNPWHQYSIDAYSESSLPGIRSVKAPGWQEEVDITYVERSNLQAGRKLEAKQIDFSSSIPQGSILKGESGKDELWGRAGWDILDGAAGNDLIRAGNGRDIITGGLGADELHGDFGWNTYKSEKDGFSDLIAIKSDQWLVNWFYGKAGNNSDGAKCDIIEGLDAIDKIKIIGCATSDLSFASTTAKGLTGIGIYAKGALEALYTGTDLSLSQIQAMTIGDASAAAMANQITSYGWTGV